MISKSMRDNYNNFGVDCYYKHVGGSYRNPHFEGVIDGTAKSMDFLFSLPPEDLLHSPLSTTKTKSNNDDIPVLKCLDLACGSGEATVALNSWNQKRLIPSRKQPKRPIGPALLNLEIVGCDPYTQKSYLDRIGKDALSIGFKEISEGCWLENISDEEEGNSFFDVVVCSFAAHLIEPSMLYPVMYQLSLASKYLLILSPHKKPQITENMGWNLIYEDTAEMRVHIRLYSSFNFSILVDQ